jgi:uncharacterized protein (TIGR03437 family)
VQVTGNFLPWAISDNARTLVLTRVITSFGRFALELVVKDLVSGEERPIHEQGTAQPLFMGVSNDGRWVLFRLAEGRLEGDTYIGDAWTGESARLPLQAGELAVDGTISGSGSVAYVSTSAGRIVRFGLVQGKPAGDAYEVIPATPYVNERRRQFCTGSMVRLEGSLRRTASELRGRLLLDGTAMPVLFAGAEGVGVQVPWEQVTGDVPFRVTVPSDSPFEQHEIAMVWPQAPAVEQAEPGSGAVLGLKMIKGDWSGYVRSTPAPGDIVHMYFTGLGSVRGAVQTGVPAPAGAVLPIEGELRCLFRPHADLAETLFAGLAPGTVGVYQVTFRMPSTAGAGPLSGMECQLKTASGSSGFGLSVIGAP